MTHPSLAPRAQHYGRLSAVRRSAPAPRLAALFAVGAFFVFGLDGPLHRPSGPAAASVLVQDTTETATDQEAPPEEQDQDAAGGAGADTGDETGALPGEGEPDPADLADPNNPFDLARPGAPINAAAASPYGLLLPDSEFVYGPTIFGFDTADYVNERGGFLSRHLELVDGQALTGGQIVERVALDYSLGPRMLLAIIELQSGWVTSPQPISTTSPLGGNSTNLHDGLTEIAETLQTLYYAHRIDGARAFPLGGGRSVTLIARNPGTWALTAWLSRGADPESWAGLEAQSRFWTAWTSLFIDDPYTFQTTETLPPGPLKKPLRLPFEDGRLWYFVEGPTSPRGVGASRASVAFSPPPAQAGGCLPSLEPVVAVSAGTIVRSEDRGVVLDLDTDEFEGSGWSIVYRHLIPQGRVQTGTKVSAGDHLGFPACMDGETQLNRVRVARKHNGEWVPADRADAPFVMSGWIVTPGTQAGQGQMTLPGLSDRRADLTKSDPVNGIAALQGR